MIDESVPKSAEAIRQWAQDQFIVVTGMEEAAPSRIDTQLRMPSTMAELLQMRLLAEIAAQLAEANALTRFELGLEDEKKEDEGDART